MTDGRLAVGDRLGVSSPAGGSAAAETGRRRRLRGGGASYRRLSGGSHAPELPGRTNMSDGCVVVDVDVDVAAAAGVDERTRLSGGAVCMDGRASSFSNNL